MRVFSSFCELLKYPLYGCGWLYGTLNQVRAALYRHGVLASLEAPVPVVSVGNLAVGGTGKTPVTEWVARFFLRRGKKVAVLSRGYGRREMGENRVVCRGRGPEIPPELAGDEPWLLARRTPELVVVVARRRAEAVKLAVEELGAEILVLDDGFQHLAVRRHLDIVLLDARRPLGNGRVLPAGPLREFPEALSRGDLFLFSHSNGQEHFPVPGRAFHCRHLLAEEAISLGGERLPLERLRKLKCAAFAGIAHPENFFEDLQKCGIFPERCRSLHDHACFSASKKAELRRWAQGVDCLLTTEKDAVKLCAGDFAIPCYAIPLEVAFDEQEELEAVLEDAVKTVSGNLVRMLACPSCGQAVMKMNDTGRGLVCSACRRSYPVRDGIPEMVEKTGNEAAD
ncbi:MAG: tetraacyldisaccharide 4'-kinase [Deltaproteobacteria bacterium]|nr:tetraacyldisaccharide 4'-kinase [Deltaproteobacteria bacterium]